jgi:isocitrate/isopropylmalate dehydrogenase
MTVKICLLTSIDFFLKQQLVGTKKANPIATLTASVEMLRHLGLDYHANVISYAIDRTVNFDKIHTPGESSI